MSALLSQTLLELKLLARMRWPLLLPVVACFYMWLRLANISESGSQDLTLHLLENLSSFHTFALALPVLLGVLLARRDMLNPSYEWLQAMPISNAGYLLAKLSAGLLYVSLMPIAVDTAFVIRHVQLGLSAADISGALLTITLYMLGSYAISLALGLTIGVLLAPRFALTIGFCAWLFGSAFLQVFIVERLQWYPLKAFYLNPFLNVDLLLNEGWIDALLRGELIRLALFVTMFGVLLFALSAAQLGRARPHDRPVRAMLAVFAALLAAAVAYLPYANMWSERYARIDMLRDNAPLEQAIAPNDRYAFRVDAVSLNIERLPDNRLAVDALFALPLRDGAPISAVRPDQAARERVADSLTFLLHPAMRVTDVALDGKSVAFSREQDRLAIPLAELGGGDGSRSVRVRCEGNMTEWMPRSGDESFWSFVHKDGLYLPGHAGWFPLPGGDSLYYRSGGELRNRPDAGRLASAVYDIRVRGFEALPIFATAERVPGGSADEFRFRERVDGVPTLYGGRFIEVAVPDERVTIVTTPGNRAESEAFLAELHLRKRYYEALLGDIEPNAIRHIAYFPTDPIDTPDYFPMEEIVGNTIFFNELPYANLDVYRLQAALRAMLFGDLAEGSYADGEDGAASIVQEIRQAMLELYETEFPDTPNLWKTGRSFAVSSGAALARDYLNAMIGEAAASGRVDQARRTLAFFYKQGLHIDEGASGGLTGRTAEHTGGVRYPVITTDDWLEVWQTFAERTNAGGGMDND